jgi:hypothetical protein
MFSNIKLIELVYSPEARTLVHQETVLRKPYCSATTKSGVYWNIEEMVLFLSKEYLDKNLTFFPMFRMQYIPDFFVA